MTHPEQLKMDRFCRYIIEKPMIPIDHMTGSIGCNFVAADIVAVLQHVVLPHVHSIISSI